MLTRVGGGLLLAGGAGTVAGVVIRLTGGDIGLAQRTAPPQSPGELVTLVTVALFGLGAATLALSGEGSAAAHVSQIRLGLIAIGLLSQAVYTILVNLFGAYAESPLLFLETAGLWAVLVGLLLTGVALARSSGWLRVIGIGLVVGLFAVPLALPLPALAAVAVLIPIGLTGIGVLTLRSRAAPGQ